MNISNDVVILTKAELKEIKTRAFLRGVERGKVEEYSRANSQPPGQVGLSAGAVDSHGQQDTVPAGRPNYLTVSPAAQSELSGEERGTTTVTESPPPMLNGAELQASSACPICGLDTPHGHYNETSEIELVARPTFDFYLRSWLSTYLPAERKQRGTVLGVGNWTNLERSKQRPPDYANPVVEGLWGLWLDAWLSKPSWCNAFDKVAMQKQIERQTTPGGG